MAKWAAGLTRIRALARKDLQEIRQQPSLILSGVAMVIGLAAPALLVVFIVPSVSGDALADPEIAQAAREASRLDPSFSALSNEAGTQAFLLHQFLMFSLMVPVMGSLSLAAQGIVGEKQSKALEPLLATPISTMELLIAKIATPFAMSMLLLASSYLLFLFATATFGETGVWRSMFWPRALLLYFVLGPLISVTALATAAIVSSRANDPRSAQQLGGLVVLPVTALLVAQLAGQFLLGTGGLAVTALVLVAVNVVLLWIGTRVFQRETILMRWK